MIGNAILFAVLNKTKEEIEAQLLYTIKSVKQHANESVAAEINEKIADLIKQVEQLYCDIEEGVALGEINGIMSELYHQHR